MTSVKEIRRRCLSRINPNQIKVRDEGIRSSVLPPGTPGARQGANVTIDRKKQQNKQAARKWKTGEDY